ncbi:MULTISPECIES: 5-formyltetrahydrofolate cyclo-ligase [Sphingomonas]|uniref:5-formyltetrahydrofolate cyclo-ligase n=1 Tax=Sphingomonas leidyi TaxID=68569 RepID=A0A7X5ZUW8_9SPHN|nr:MULTISPECIES: 5-formyltetrahydrofolate cyclo-ligase [Sphingomonas]MBN8810750.1 5-formyltetrahydrofolate cyclo-ligase [Sphingomonas sp.]NIJ64511.1 5-formyltetrahydrofolate cyclo-ligase [Sphingomonas leidyi]OJY49344.1 MAG: 5-formyltetrahydrofolate cyclo-ligase [Sphingomonas sp. 67-41]
MIDKLALRAQLRAERDAFAIEASEAILAPEAFVDRLAAGATVATYVAIGSEADPTQLAAAAAEKGCALALPFVVDRAAPIRFLAWRMGEPLADGPFGLRQPRADSPEVAPDVILTPLVGFDARLNRLGQGAAHYDRAFARYPDAWRVGVAWAMQEVPAVPSDIWDVPLQAVITEKGMTWHAGA